MERPEQMLWRLLEQRLIAPLDLHFARFMLEQAGRGDAGLALAAALTSAARGEGHVCLNLPSLAARPLLAGTVDELMTPSLDDWRAGLLQSGVVGRPGAWQPLILDTGDRLYLHRYWDYEQRVGRSLLRRASALAEGIEEESLKQGLDDLFAEEGEAGEVAWQKIAGATAVLQRLCLISGGPGTGKTSTVVRILALLRQQPGGAGLRIALAAPTGMAASRLQQSIRSSKRRLPLAAEVLEAIPEQALTLHRLLGVRRGGTGFRHHRENPLPLDLLLLDEASMVDLSLMAHLLDALPERSRLIMLGDRDQLASVEAGAVLGDLCQGCEGAGEAFSGRLRALTGEPLAASASPAPLRDQVVILRRSYRFGPHSAIGRLAAAINQGQAERALQLLRARSEDAEIGWSREDAAVVAARHYARLFDRLREGAPVAELFEILRAFRLLCALRGGPQGVERMNRLITRQLVATGKLGSAGEWYPGRPLMVTRNDYDLGLYNGDVGMVLPHPDEPQQLAVAFPDGDASTRWVAPARLSACETVFAMTVHKSQGSEFDQVLLLLPEQSSPVLCRELIYTAVTRARKRFSLAGSEAVLQQAVARSLVRHSGLQELLQSGTQTYPLPADSAGPHK
jgi:exodeoxyribonuclease V alpha subunit